jgi:hypothetical protein
MSIKKNSRRNFLGLAAAGFAGATVGVARTAGAIALPYRPTETPALTYDVRTFGAKGDGSRLTLLLSTKRLQWPHLPVEELSVSRPAPMHVFRFTSRARSPCIFKLRNDTAQWPSVSCVLES